MLQSLRGRLLAWSSALLVLALITFGTLVAYSTWHAWLGDVDRGLEMRLRALTAAISPTPDGAVDVVVPANALPSPDLDYYGIWNGDGTLLVASGEDVTDVVRAPGRTLVDAHREHVSQLPNGMTVMVGRRVDTLVTEIRRLVVAMVGVGVAALVLVFAGGWWIVGRALSPVERIGHTARAMIDGDLTARIQVPRVESELAQLAGVLNEAFDRLYQSLERQRRFTADASHDLRTPLTTLQTETHWALSRPRTVDEYRASLEVCQRAAIRMHALTQSLLDLARAESTSGITPQRCPVADLVPVVVRDLQAEAAAHQVTITTGALDGIVVADQPSCLAAITNLVTNGIQYNVPDGTVHIESTTADGWVDITVRDTGVGLAPADAARVFDRFYRVDPSRTGRAGGSGLGLALVAAFARSHGGTVSVTSTAGTGSVFLVRLPTQHS